MGGGTDALCKYLVMRPIIALDFDQTLIATFETAWASFQELRWWKLSAPEAMAMHEGWWKHPSINISQKEAFAMFDDFALRSWDLEAFPVEGAQEGVAEIISDGIYLIIVTARVESVRKASTIHSLWKHFPSLVDVPHYFIGLEADGPPTKNKGQVCHEAGVSILVDDSLTLLRHAVSFGVTGILLSTSSNYSLAVPEGIWRANSWADIPEMVRRIAKI